MGVYLMFYVTSDVMELRGIQSKVSQKTQKAYYILLCEDIESTEQYKFLCKDFNKIPQGLKKGDHIELRLAYNIFKEFDVLEVVKVN